jgi:signal transduction histidine kinase/ligand-binding sensor domain-containing protein
VWGLNLLATAAQAQLKPYRFEHVVPAGLMSSSPITSVVQDREGLLWIASNGLYAYDGTRFTHYDTLADGRSITNREVTCLLYDSLRNRLLVGTYNFGVLEYNYETNLIRALPATEGYPIIDQLVLDHQGRVWVSSFNSGLYWIEADTLKRAQVKNYNSIRTTYLLALHNELLVGDLRKVYRIANNQVIDSIELQWNNTYFSEHGPISCLHQNGKHLYIGTERLGILIYDLQAQKFVNFLAPDKNPLFNRINRIYTDRSGTVWILTRSGGMALYYPATGYLQPLHIKSEDAFAGRNDNFLDILEDKTGIIWIATTGTLIKYDPHKFWFEHITQNPLNALSLSDKMVRCVYAETDSLLIIGTDDGYLNFVDLKKKQTRWVKISTPGSSKNFMPASIAQLDAHHLLIGTQNGLLVMNKTTRTFRNFNTNYPELSTGLIRQIINANNHLYIIKTGSLYTLNLKSEGLKIIRHNNNTNNKLTVRGTSIIYLDSYNRLWLGVDGGLSLLNPDSTFTYFPIEPESSRPDGSSFMVLHIQEAHGYLWISTFNYGLWKLRLAATGQQQHTAEQVNLPPFNKSTLYCALPDKNGNLWLTSNEGLLSLNPVTGNLTTFLPEQGVQALEFNRLAFTITPNGTFVVGGVNGINLFRPENVSLTAALPKPAFLHTTAKQPDGKQLYINLRNKKEIHLAPNYSSISFAYVLSSFSTPQNFRVEYKLEGLDNSWTAITGNEIRFPVLKPGNYILRLRTSLPQRTTEASAINIIVPPPLWQRDWFIGLCTLLLVVIVLTAFRLQVKINERAKQKLEQLLRERTAEIEKSREELKSLNEKKDLIFSILSHDIRSPLTTLKGFLSLLEETANQMPPEQVVEFAKKINHAVGSALDLVDNTLYWSLSQNGRLPYQPAPFNLSDLMNKIYNLNQLTALRKRVNLTLESQDNIWVMGDERMLHVALRNVVSNAIKFTPEWKSVHIKIEQINSQALVTITDEGIGMSSDYLQRVLKQEQVASKTGTANERGTGLGLMLCRTFVAMNKGSIDIKSQEGKGTEFRIYLPLASDGLK